jgi:FemAB-related protein (PEP-CTERM system-associated)
VIPSFFGVKRKAISLPYSNYGGTLCSQGVSECDLKNLAVKFLRGKGIQYVEIRQLSPGAQNSKEVTMQLNLPGNKEEFFMLIGSKVRNQIRKARKFNLTIQWGQDQLDDLYITYAKNMGRLGTPVHTKLYFDQILKNFKSSADILTIRKDGFCIASMLIIKHGDTWIDPVASSLVEFKHMNPNMLMYWEALNKAIESGVRLFDFGRSARSSGTFFFKSQWGARPVNLSYQAYFDGKQILGCGSIDSYRGRGASYISLFWRQLPISLQLRLGPKLRKFIP